MKNLNHPEKATNHLAEITRKFFGKNVEVSVSHSTTSFGASSYITVSHSDRYSNWHVEGRISDHSLGERRFFDYQFLATASHDAPLGDSEITEWLELIGKCVNNYRPVTTLEYHLNYLRKLCDTYTGDWGGNRRREHRREIKNQIKLVNESFQICEVAV